MLNKWLIFGLLAVGLTAAAPVHAQDDRERRLNTVTVTSLPPDKGELHINPIIRRPQDFARPGFSEMELVFVPVALIEDDLVPLLGEENQDYLKLITQMPERPEGIAFEDNERTYKTQSVILPRGYYVLSEVSFRQKAQLAGAPDLQMVSHCLAEDSFMLHVKGGDVMFMGHLEFDYPTQTRLADPEFNPAAGVLESFDRLRGWRWTTKDLVRFDVIPTTFKRTNAFCNPQASTPSS